MQQYNIFTRLLGFHTYLYLFFNKLNLHNSPIKSLPIIESVFEKLDITAPILIIPQIVWHHIGMVRTCRNTQWKCTITQLPDWADAGRHTIDGPICSMIEVINFRKMTVNNHLPLSKRTPLVLGSSSPTTIKVGTRGRRKIATRLQTCPIGQITLFGISSRSGIRIRTGKKIAKHRETAN